MDEKINIYLQKVADKKIDTKKDTWGMFGRGMVGNAVAGPIGAVGGYATKVDNIAKQHGKNITVGRAAKSGAATYLRSAGRSLGEGVAGGVGGAGVGAAVGTGIGALAHNVHGGAYAGAVVGGAAGAIGGLIHGTAKSLNNSVKKYHAEFSQEKKAEILAKFAGLAGVATRIIAAGKSAGGAIVRDAKALPDQANRVRNTFKTGTGLPIVAGSSPRLNAVKGLAKNKAVLSGVGGLTAAGIAGKMMGSNKRNDQ